MKRYVMVLMSVLFIVLLWWVNNAFALYFSCYPSEYEFTTKAQINGVRLKECLYYHGNTIFPDYYNTYFENQYGFSSNHRVAWATNYYNCHSLSFNDRFRWMNYPHNIFWSFYNHGLVVNYNWAKKWDRWVMFTKDSNGPFSIWWVTYSISHSFIFDEDYKGWNTRIKSKYGSFGEYKHALSSVYNVYDADYTFVLRHGGTNFMYTKVWWAVLNDRAMHMLTKSSVIDLKPSEKLYQIDLKNIWWEEKDFSAQIPFEIDVEKLWADKHQKTQKVDNSHLLALSDQELVNMLTESDLMILWAASSPNAIGAVVQKNALLKTIFDRAEKNKETIELVLNKTSSFKYGTQFIQFLQ